MNHSPTTNLALISDIHGNLTALEAVLADIARQKVEQVVCLGDVAAFGPQPVQVVERLQELNYPTVMGNTDSWLLAPGPFPPRDEETRLFYDIELWAAEQLTQDHLAFIRSFRPTLDLSLNGQKTLLAYHGSPKSDTDLITATTPEEALADLLAGRRADILAGGHSHAPMLRRYQEMLLLNPGSVGLPYVQWPDGRNRNPAWAEYAIVRSDQADLAVTFRRVPYNAALVVEAALTSGMPHAEWWSNDWQTG
jgi:putative phosphoesterase